MKKFTKSVIAVLMTVLMICSVLPMTAFAAGTGVETQASGNETRTCTFYILYVDDSVGNLGYAYGPYAKWDVNYVCQYSSCGTDSYNHSMACSVIKEQADHAKTIVNTTEKFGDGWEIKGWTKTANANPQILTTYTGTTATQTSYTIYLVAKKTTPTTHDVTLTYNAGEGVFDSTKTNTLTDTKKDVAINSSAEFSITSEVPTLDGHAFKGWSTTNGGSVAYTANDKCSIKNNTTLYAVWEENEPETQTITLTYDANNGAFSNGDTTTTTKSETQTVNVGASATFDIIEDVPVYEGYTFQYWTVSDNTRDASQYKFGDSITITADTTLIAVWEKNSTAPAAPNAEDINGIVGTDFLKIVCKNDEAHNMSFTISRDVILSISNPELKNDVYTVTVTVNGAPFISTYNYLLKQSGVTVEHELDDENTKSFDLIYTDGKWVLASGVTGVTFYVKEKTTPTDPSKVSEPSVEKTADKTTVKAGEDVKFNLSVALPDYLNNYLYDDPQNPEIATQVQKYYVMTINDSYDEKFGNLAGLTVTVVHADGTTSALTASTAETVNDYTFTADADNHSFNIRVDLVDLFNKGLLTANDIENIGKVRINVEYTLTMSSDAAYGTFTNTASVSYIDKDGKSATSEASNASVQVYAIEIKKLDNADKVTLLPNAKFNLLDADKNKINEGTTGSDGTLTFNGLAGGTYFLEETDAPEGYAKSGKLLEVTLDGNGKIVTVNFYNSKVPHTGSDTALIFSIAGIVIVGAGFAGYAITRKKREN